MSPHKPNIYQRYSVGIMAILVFLLPMVVVGAIKAKGNNRNDVKGWLPLEYPETQVYRFFRRNFQGEEFILISWEGCTMTDPRLELLAQKLLPPPEEASRIDRPIYFKTAQTGPRAVERMMAEPLNLDREESVSRLTGALIGPPPAGVAARIRVTPGRKPRSAMWSASSITVIATSSRVIRRCRIRSSRRPGQATTMSTPARSADSWRLCDTPPKIVVTFRP
jgi:hypothetical protein